MVGDCVLGIVQGGAGNKGKARVEFHPEMELAQSKSQCSWDQRADIGLNIQPYQRKQRQETGATEEVGLKPEGNLVL